MPGHNHYKNCTCGWCVHERVKAETRALTLTNNRKYSLSEQFINNERILFENGVQHSRSACFIYPNAHCPVCNQAVFFYQNSFGSRVFFDEVGWPWPKHPCTDNGKKVKGRTATLSIRSLLSIYELKKAAFENKIKIEDRFIQSYKCRPPEFIEIIEMYREGRDNLVVAKLLDSLDGSSIYFSFQSIHRVLQVGSWTGVHRSKEMITFIPKGGLEPLQYPLTIYSDTNFLQLIRKK